MLVRPTWCYVAADIDRDVNPYRTPTESNVAALILNQIAYPQLLPSFYRTRDWSCRPDGTKAFFISALARPPALSGGAVRKSESVAPHCGRSVSAKDAQP